MDNEVNNPNGTVNEYEEVTFINDQGGEESFLHILTFNYEGGKYAALVSEEQIDEDEPEVLFVKIIRDGDGDAYVPVENEVLLEELFEEFTALLDETYDEDEEEE